MREFIIADREAGQRMDKYVCRILSGAPKSFVYKMMRKKNIVLNDKKALGQEILKEHDSIKIYFSDETFEKFASDKGKDDERSRQKPVTLKPDVVYEDDDILIINKPAGLLSQKADASDYSANEMVIDYLLDTGQITKQDLVTFRPSVCNRLDRNTSGLLTAGKTIRGLQKMGELLKDRSVKKFYHAMVWGRIDRAEHLKGCLVKDHKTNRVRILPEGEGDFIETAYRPIAHYKGATLLEIHLITGRSHQIRAHLASVGHPLLGDTKYGEARVNKQLQQEIGVPGQLLSACRMEFPDGKVIQIKDPDSFQRAADWLERK